jgi:hypothetical protein
MINRAPHLSRLARLVEGTHPHVFSDGYFNEKIRANRCRYCGTVSSKPMVDAGSVVACVLCYLVGYRGENRAW